MIFYRVECRDNHPKGPVDMHYADSFQEALDYCRLDITAGALEPPNEYWIWKEETGYDKDTTEKLGSMSASGVFTKTEDEPHGFCDWCDKAMKESDREYLRDDGPCSCTVYCSQECIDAYHAAH